jgi:peptide/nickel transport system substrate-binding protein
MLACAPSGKRATAPGATAGIQADQGTPQYGGTLNVYLNRNFKLDPQQGSALDQQSIAGVMSRLFKFKTGLDPNVTVDHLLENDLGVSAESPDAVTWTIKLRPDAKFHNVAPVNGHAVEAEDVKATFVRGLDPALPNPNRGSLNMIDPAQIQTPDKQTVVFKLNYPYAPFAQTLGSPSYSWIYPREVLSGSYDPSKIAIGSGPFLFESFTPDVAYVYKRNPDWFEKEKPYIDTLRVAIIPETPQQLAQFTSGNIDEHVFTNPYDVAPAKQQNPNARVLKTEYALPTPLVFQLGDSTSVFQDIRVRRAFSMAIDRDALSSTILNGEGEVMVFIPSYMGKWAAKAKDLPPDIQQYYKYNPAEARKLLEAAGQSNLQIKFAYTTPTTPDRQKNAETVSNMLNAAGIKTNIVVWDFNKDWIDAGKGGRQGYFPKDTVPIINAAPYSDADEYLFSYFHSSSTTNQEHVKDVALDAMIDKQRTLVNRDERLQSVLDIQRYLAEKMYMVPTVGSYKWAFVQPRVRNYQFSSTVGVPTETYAKLWLKA